MKLNTDQDGLALAPFTVSGHVGFVLPVIKRWSKREDVTDIAIHDAAVEPSSSGEHAYLVVEATVYTDGGEHDVVACSCGDFHYRKGSDGPADSKLCKHGRSLYKAEKAKADDAQVTLGGEE